MMFMQETYFSDEQKFRLLKLFGDQTDSFQQFHDAITPSIYYASMNDVSEKSKKQVVSNALESGEKFREKLEEGSFLWNLLWFSKDGFEELLALNKLIEKLRKPINKGHSRYRPLAAAVGISMKKAGLIVCGSYTSVTVDFIEICIAAAGLPDSENYRELTQIAKKSADIFSGELT